MPDGLDAQDHSAVGSVGEAYGSAEELIAVDGGTTAFDGVAGIGVDTVAADLSGRLAHGLAVSLSGGRAGDRRVGVDDLMAFGVAAADPPAGLLHHSVVESLLDP